MFASNVTFSHQAMEGRILSFIRSFTIVSTIMGRYPSLRHIESQMMSKVVVQWTRQEI